MWTLLQGLACVIFQDAIPLLNLTLVSYYNTFLFTDKIIGRITKALQQQGVQSLMIYTARQPSKVSASQHLPASDI